MRFFDWLQRRGERPQRVYPASPEAEAQHKATASMREAIQRNECPDCHHKGFLAGPEGGLAQNIMCANPACCSAFNVSSFAGDLFYVDRIPNGYWNPSVKKDASGRVVS